MKINKPLASPVDFQKMAKQKKAPAAKASVEDSPSAPMAKPTHPDVDRVLGKVVGEIERSGLSAGDIHSGVDEAKVNGFLQSMEAQSKQPQMSEEDLLALADKTAHAQRANPQAATNTFNSLDPQRVAELV